MQDHLSFEAHSSKKTNKKDAEQFNLMIDYHDIISVSILKIPNEDAADHAEKFVQKNYRFIYLLQIEVSTINGLSVIDKSPALDTTEDQTHVDDDRQVIDKSPAPETTEDQTHTEDERQVIDKPLAPETTGDQPHTEEECQVIDKTPAPETTDKDTPIDIDEHQQPCNENQQLCDEELKQKKIAEKPKFGTLI